MWFEIVIVIRKDEPDYIFEITQQNIEPFQFHVKIGNAYEIDIIFSLLTYKNRDETTLLVDYKLTYCTYCSECNILDF